MMINCPACRKTISSVAQSCPVCGHPINSYNSPARVIIEQRQARQGSHLLALLLSIIIPGLGQLYLGRVASGLFLFIFTAVFYVVFFPIGLFFHICAVLGACCS